MIFLQIYIPTVKYSLIQMACVVKVGNMSFINGNLIFLLVKLNHLSLVLDLKKKNLKSDPITMSSQKKILLNKNEAYAWRVQESVRIWSTVVSLKIKKNHFQF